MNKKSIAFIWGSGAVKNAWLPLGFLTPFHFKKKLSNDGCNSALASLVYNLRFHRPDANDTENYIYTECKRILTETRISISQNIKHFQSTREMSVQDEFTEIINRFITQDCNRLLLITSNWDTVIDEALKMHPVLKRFNTSHHFCTHLHGSFENPNFLYLPTEALREQYRTVEEENYLGKIHTKVMSDLAEANILIIYGLSISPLDPELMQVLGAAIELNTNIECVKIVDCNHEAVAEKMSIIIRHPRKINIEGYHPEQLNKVIDYTL